VWETGGAKGDVAALSDKIITSDGELGKLLLHHLDTLPVGENFGLRGGLLPVRRVSYCRREDCVSWRNAA
jgi:hypothetical protein